eukprot:1172612-Rhodomonas_salina.4
MSLLLTLQRSFSHCLYPRKPPLPSSKARSPPPLAHTQISCSLHDALRVRGVPSGIEAHPRGMA